MKKIGIITYQAKHLKTEQILLRLLGHYLLRVYALPYVKRTQREVLFQHRPNQATGADPYDICALYDIPYVKIESDMQIDNQCDFYLIAGAGILSARAIFDKKILNSHPGIIPASRGLDSFKWAVLNQIPLGNTLHYIDENVDIGKIITIQPTPVFACDTLESLARRHYENEINLICQFEYYMTYPHNPFIGIPTQPSTRRMPIDKERLLKEAFEKYKKRYVSAKSLEE